jgi:hypothetical protein
MAEEISGVSEITLKWTANDLDNDITGYDVYFGTDSVPVIYANDMDDNELIVSVVSDTIYYWRIITNDSLGNTSDTGVYQFRII